MAGGEGKIRDALMSRRSVAARERGVSVPRGTDPWGFGTALMDGTPGVWMTGMDGRDHARPRLGWAARRAKRAERHPWMRSRAA